MNEVTCVQCCSEPGSPRLAIHTPNLSIPIVRLQFISDTEMQEWQVHFTSVCKEIHSISGEIFLNMTFMK